MAPSRRSARTVTESRSARSKDWKIKAAAIGLVLLLLGSVAIALTTSVGAN